MKYRKFLIGLFVIILIFLGIWLITKSVASAKDRQAQQELQEEINSLIDSRFAAQVSSTDTDVFGDDGLVSILLLGLDSRAGEETTHCDVIQFIEINDKEQTLKITAVPRGTYAPLPGTGHIPSDYYVSNACGIGGIEYGIDQIEKILGKKADHVVLIGFSEALGAFRLLGLPTTETLQWLRVRQPYTIGEPQRAHNHSTFLKELILKQTLVESSRLHKALEYLLYRFVDTDLAFAEAQSLVAALTDFDLSSHPERISLFMRPQYFVQDIPYDVETLSLSLETPFNPDGPSKEQVQQELIDAVNAGLEDAMFVETAFDQHLWLQLDNDAVRESVHFAILSAYLSQVEDEEIRQGVLADYVIEMNVLEETEWAERGREMLNQEFISTSSELN